MLCYNVLVNCSDQFYGFTVEPNLATRCPHLAKVVTSSDQRLIIVYDECVEAKLVEYLADQLGNLERMIDYIEFEKYNDMGVEADQFDIELAKQVAALAATATLEELMILFDAQSNVESERALQLLTEELYEEAP